MGVREDRHLEIAFQRRKFMRDPRRAEYSYDEIGKIYKVSRGVITRWRKEAGIAVDRTKQSQGVLNMLNDPDFGNEGEVAPISGIDMAERHKISIGTVNKYRQQLGVIPFQEKPSSWQTRRPPWTLSQRRVFALINGWPRPKGMSEHLEVINEKRHARKL